MRKKRKMLQLWIVGEEVDWSKCKKIIKKLQLLIESKKMDWSKCKGKEENGPIEDRKQKNGLEQM